MRPKAALALVGSGAEDATPTTTGFGGATRGLVSLSTERAGAGAVPPPMSPLRGPSKIAPLELSREKVKSTIYLPHPTQPDVRCRITYLLTDRRYRIDVAQISSDVASLRD